MKKTIATPDRRVGRWLTGALLLAAGIATATAQQALSVTLAGDAEVPAVTTQAKGSGQISVQADHSISGSITVSGMAATAAHIHEGAAGKNGPVAVPLSKGGDDSFMVPPGAKLTDAQYASYQAGNLYINVHSAAHASGEIRAQLTPSMAAAPAKAPTKSGY